MPLVEHLDPLRLYTPKEVAELLGPAVSVSWIKGQARRRPKLCTRHTGRRTILFTAEQVVLLRTLLTGSATEPPAAHARPATDRTSTSADQPAAGVVEAGADGSAQPMPVAPRPFRSLHTGS